MKVCILGTAHRLREPGKQSPDGQLKECEYSRDIVSRIHSELCSWGIKSFIDYLPLDLPKSSWSSVVKTERQRELDMRVNYVNGLCKEYGSENVFYVSVHVDAFGNGRIWHDPHGWSVRVSPHCSDGSRRLASCLAEVATEKGLFVRRPAAALDYWEQSLFVLNKTLCPAVLTENLFMDNKSDVEFLLSERGRKTIVDTHVSGILRYY